MVEDITHSQDMDKSNWYIGCTRLHNQAWLRYIILDWANEH